VILNSLLVCRHPEYRKHGTHERFTASNSLSEAESLTHKHDNASAVLVDMADQAIVENLISQSDVVISLLPVPFHPSVAELCIKQRKHLVTASYISPAMKDLHERFVTPFAIWRRCSRNAAGR